jgi:DNA-binding protein HU-beta
MNKDKLVKALGERLNKSPKEMKESVEEIFSLIKERLAEGEPVQIVGFGKFNVRKRKARMGRDPNTGEKMHLPETDTPTFSPSKNLTNSVKKR